MANYKKYFAEAWMDLQKQFIKGNVEPHQENDITCYLYYSLLNRFKRDNIKPKVIRTEDTIGNRRVDININKRIFVEIRLLNRIRDYGEKAWNAQERKILELAGKLKGYIKHLKLKRDIQHVRWPVIALWNYARGYEENRFISNELKIKLENLRIKLYKQKILLYYGPMKDC